MNFVDRKDLQVLTSTLEGYTGRIFDRLHLENMSIPVRNTPIGGPEGIDALNGFWEHAREGFKMTFRMDREGLHNINPGLLLAATTAGGANGIWDEIRGLGIGIPLESPRLSPALVFFEHVLVSIGNLNKKGRVSIASLEPPLEGRRLGSLAQQNTDWRRNIDPEGIWGTINELARGSRMALYQSGNFDRGTIDPILRAAQFFAEGVNLTQKFAAD